MTTTTPEKIKVAEPDFFNGNPTEFRNWRRQLLIFLRAGKVDDDDDKILTALSYMKGGTATPWASRFINDNIAATTLGTWAQFLTQLEAVFNDKTATKKARKAIEHFQQGRQGIDEFFNKFEVLAQEAGLGASEVEKIRLLERNVNAPTINSIYSSGSIPDKYDDYRQHILKISRLWEQR